MNGVDLSVPNGTCREHGAPGSIGLRAKSKHGWSGEAGRVDLLLNPLLVGTNPMKCIQINLHRAKAASSALQQRFLNEGFQVGFIQEPWTVKDKVSGLGTRKCKLIFCRDGGRPRTALLFDNATSFIPLTGFLTTDLTAAIISTKTEQGRRDIIVASAYFPCDGDNPPTPEVKALVQFSKRKNIQLVSTF